MTYLVVYFRFLSRHRMLSLINIFGLSVGFAACIFIGLYIHEELSYDRYHDKAERIFVVTTDITSEESVTKVSTASTALAPRLNATFPEIEEAVRLETIDNATVRFGDVTFKEDRLYRADATVFDVFTWPLVQGDPGSALREPGSIVLTLSLARKYFGQQEAMGKAVQVNGVSHRVTGIMEDLPTATDLPFTALASFADAHNGEWYDFEAHTYLLFRDNVAQSGPALAHFKNGLAALADESYRELEENTGLSIELPVAPLTGVHFRAPTYDDTPKGDMRFIYIIGSVALLLLLIGSMNFINFSLVQSLERGREVGIRKIMGAQFHQLVGRYLGESVLITFMAFVVAAGLVVVFMPLLAGLSGKPFGVEKLFNGEFLASALLIVLAVGVLAGSFPAFFTSSIRPVQALKGKITGLRGQWFRKASVLVQFAIAMGLVICTGLINRQMNFMAHYDLGIRKDNMVVIDTPTDSVGTRRVHVLKEALAQLPGVESVATLGYGALPGTDPMKGTLKVKADGETRITNILGVDENYLPTLGIALAQGRNFDPSRPNDKGRTAIVNRAFARQWGWDEPVQEHIQWDGRMEVIGVMEDFHFSSLHQAIEPTILLYPNDVADNVLVRFHASVPVGRQMELAATAWADVFTNEPFQAHFFDESLAMQYLQEERALGLFTVFSVLTIVVSCLGLFGLCSLAISQRRREVGIRKVIGASFSAIVTLFSRVYLVLIGVSFVLVAPASFWLVSAWLASFAQRASVSPWVFAGAGLGVLALGLGTVVLSIGKTWGRSPAELVRE